MKTLLEKIRQKIEKEPDGIVQSIQQWLGNEEASMVYLTEDSSPPPMNGTLI